MLVKAPSASTTVGSENDSLSWGAFPVLTAHFAQTGHVSLAAILAAAGACAISGAQRHLSTPARSLRRRTRQIRGTITGVDGSSRPIDADTVLQPLEAALRSLSWGMVAVALGMVVGKLS